MARSVEGIKAQAQHVTYLLKFMLDDLMREVNKAGMHYTLTFEVRAQHV